jgi:predicted RNA binding protein YcfA (HicA-like mRNA interferase family)
MPRPLSLVEVARILRANGFVCVLKTKAHRKFRDSKRRVVIVPVADELCPMALEPIIKASGLDRTLFL